MHLKLTPINTGTARLPWSLVGLEQLGPLARARLRPGAVYGRTGYQLLRSSSVFSMLGSIADDRVAVVYQFCYASGSLATAIPCIEHALLLTVQRARAVVAPRPPLRR